MIEENPELQAQLESQFHIFLNSNEDVSIKCLHDESEPDLEFEWFFYEPYRDRTSKLLT
jgi:hypothetical protein